MIDEILEVLSDGEWHDFNELARQTGVNVLKLDMFLTFLKEYDFGESGEFEKDFRVVRHFRIKTSLKKFLENIKAVEKAPR